MVRGVAGGINYGSYGSKVSVTRATSSQGGSVSVIGMVYDIYDPGTSDFEDGWPWSGAHPRGASGKPCLMQLSAVDSPV